MDEAVVASAIDELAGPRSDAVERPEPQRAVPDRLRPSMIVGERFHLTYCSNIHPGETWNEVSAALASSLPRVRELLGHRGPFAIGLRLSAQAAQRRSNSRTSSTRFASSCAPAITTS